MEPKLKHEHVSVNRISVFLNEGSNSSQGEITAKELKYFQFCP